MKVLFLSDGEMNLWTEGHAKALHSARLEKYLSTTRELESRNAWKYEGASARFQHQQSPYEVQRRIAEAECRVSAVGFCGGQVLYGFTTPDMGGLYLKPADDDTAPESSWLSERAFCPRDMHVQGDQVALALDMPHGECHIALMTAGRSGYDVLTLGDTQDTAPFLCADGRTLYYASAGYARDEAGRIIAKGPSSLLEMNVKTGDLQEIFADDALDYLRPRVGPDGCLYFIRRPYEQPGGKRLTLGDRAKNAGAFFKGMVRLFQFIGDPEGAAKRMPRVAGQSDDAAQKRMLEGVLVDVTRTKDADTDDDERGCVPDTWVLMRRETDGRLTEIIRGAADYDFCGDALIYSDGRRIIRLENGRKTVLHKAVFIPRLVVAE